MRIVPNAGTDRVIDSVIPGLRPSAAIDGITPERSLVAFGELREQLRRLAGARTNRHLINERIESLVWVAALKPMTVGVPAFVDETREYPEIAVISAIVRNQGNVARLASLVHRAIPYPVLLILQSERQAGSSAAHKRRSLGEAGKVVLDDEGVWVSINDATDAPWLPAFLDALTLSRLPRTSMLTLYQGWIDTLVALVAARLTGIFSLLASAPEAGVRRTATSDYERTEVEIGRVRKLSPPHNQRLASLQAGVRTPAGRWATLLGL